MILGVYYLTMRKLADYKDDPKMVAQVSSDTVYNDIEELKKLTAPDAQTGKAQVGLHDLIWFEDTTDNNRRVLCRPIDVIGRYYGSTNLAMLAYENKEITLHQEIHVYRTATLADGTTKSGFISTTVGLLIFNENIPQDLGFVDRSNPENALLLEVDFHVGKKQIKKILEKVINTHGATRTAEVLDNVKAMGYKYSTQAAMTVSISDMTVPPQKPQMIEDAQNTVDRITRQYKRGLITDEERYKEVVETWKETDDELTHALLSGLDKYNNIFIPEPVVPISRSSSLPACED
jgi:DNA-directed RNA polymerase subunit beta'